MKNLIIPMLFIIMTALCSCDGKHSGQSLADDIAGQLSANLAALDDSTFRNTVITSIGDSDRANDFSVTTSDAVTDDQGNVYINVTVEQDSDKFSDEWWIGLSAILAILLAFTAPVAAVFIVCFFIYRNKRDRNRVVMESVTTGRPLPPAYLNNNEAAPRLQPAVNYIAWSVGLFLCFGAHGWGEAALLMTIPFIVGLGKLTSYILYTSKQKKADNKRPCDAD